MAKTKTKKKNRSPSFDPTDYTNPRALESMVRSTFKIAVERQKTVSKQYPDVYIDADLEPARMKRRISAVVDSMPRVLELAKEVCPYEQPVFSIEEEWAFVNTFPLQTYDQQEEDLNLLTGAAIWMLDRIKRNRKIQAAINLLPTDDDAIEQANVPPIYDPVHEEHVICGMVSVIQNRNADCLLPGQNRSKRKRNTREESGRPVSDLLTAMGEQHQDVPSRQRFEQLLEMIPSAEIEQAVQTYEERLFAFVRLFFQCRATYCVKEQQLQEEMVRFCDSMAGRASRLSKPELQKHPLKAPQRADPLHILSAPARSFSASQLGQLLDDPRELLTYFEWETGRIDEEMFQVKNEATKMSYFLNHLLSQPYEVVKRDYGEEISELVKDFRLGDPYEICFAMLYLLDSGSNLPWLYYPCYALNDCAGHMLPWYYTDFDELEDWHWGQYYSIGDGYVPPVVQKPTELPDWYELEYTNRSRDPDNLSRMNLAQLFYESTGCLLPRDMHRFDDSLRLLRQYCVNRKSVQTPMLCAMVVASESKYQSCLPFKTGVIPEDVLPALTEKEQSDAVNKLQDKPDETQRGEIETLKRENDRLKRIAYEADREVKSLRHDYETLLEKSQRERQELAELREMLFHQENDSEPELDEEAETVALPYNVRHTTVVFGGHDSWARAIKPMLEGDIRFIDRDMQPEASLIRHADVVWLQPNSIRHSYFYKIIKIVRSHRVPFHYFQFASAEKCARQLAGVDERLW